MTKKERKMKIIKDIPAGEKLSERGNELLRKWIYQTRDQTWPKAQLILNLIFFILSSGFTFSYFQDLPSIK